MLVTVALVSQRYLDSQKMKTPATCTNSLERVPTTAEQRKPGTVADFLGTAQNLPMKVRNHQQRHLDGCCFVIAEGGMGVNLPEPIPVGSVVQLQLALPAQSTRLNVWAIVRYQLDHQHGFEFLSLTEHERLSVRQFCNELATQQRSAQDKSGMPLPVATTRA